MVSAIGPTLRLNDVICEVGDSVELLIEKISVADRHAVVLLNPQSNIDERERPDQSTGDKRLVIFQGELRGVQHLRGNVLTQGITYRLLIHSAPYIKLGF